MFRSSKDVNLAPNVSKPDEPGVDIEIYKCNECNEGEWMSETEVEMHKAKKHFSHIIHNNKDKDNLCFICLFRCKDKDEVVRHIKMEHLLSSEDCIRVEREIFVCDICSALFFNKKNLSVHVIYTHKEFNHLYADCPLCSKRIKTINVLSHFYKHHVQSVSTCRICLRKCKGSRDLKEHMKSHFPHLKCNMCYYDTKRIDRFQNHILTTHKNVKADVREEYIERLFIPKQQSFVKLQRLAGVRGLKLSNKVHLCILCREVCVGIDEMKNHVREHSTPVEVAASYECSCGQAFSNKVLLKHHAFKSNHVVESQ